MEQKGKKDESSRFMVGRHFRRKSFISRMYVGLRGHSFGFCWGVQTAGRGGHQDWRRLASFFSVSHSMLSEITDLLSPVLLRFLLSPHCPAAPDRWRARAQAVEVNGRSVQNTHTPQISLDFFPHQENCSFSSVPSRPPLLLLLPPSRISYYRLSTQPVQIQVPISYLCILTYASPSHLFL